MTHQRFGVILGLCLGLSGPGLGGCAVNGASGTTLPIDGGNTGGGGTGGGGIGGTGDSGVGGVGGRLDAQGQGGKGMGGQAGGAGQGGGGAGAGGQATAKNDAAMGDVASTPDGKSSDGPVDVVAAGDPCGPVNNPETRSRVAALDDIFYKQLAKFRSHIFSQIGNNGLDDYTDAEAISLGYSSAMGLAVYHTMDEMIALAHAMDSSCDPRRQVEYAKLASDAMDLIVEAVATRNFRYLDEAHGTGGAGFAMLAMYHNPGLRMAYGTQLKGWANKLRPIIDKNFGRTSVSSAAHMSAKIAPGFLAVGEILEQQKYTGGFVTIAKGILAQLGTSEWVGGNDVSHTDITVQVLHLAYREEQRGTMAATVGKDKLANFARGFLARSSFADRDGGGYGVLVFVSPDLDRQAAALQLTFSGSTGSHGLAYYYAITGSLMVGYATVPR